MTRKKRKYTRLVASKWAELRAFWETGDHDLAELSHRYGVSRRAIQSHVSKHGSVKGAKAAEIAATVQKEIFTEELGDQATLVHRAKEIRESTYTSAKRVRELMMAQVEIAQNDPIRAFKAGTAVKTLLHVASALQRLHATQLRALGLDKDTPLAEEMPVLTIRDLSKEQLKAKAERDESDEESDLGIPIAPAGTESGPAGSGTDESDDIVTEGFEEGDETEEAAKPSPTSLCPLGGRLVREHKP
jgi:hypothetical protein